MVAPQSSTDLIVNGDLIASLFAPARVLDLQTWAAISGISHMTARRLIASGNGPRVTRLSPRRIGIRLSDHINWLTNQQEED